MTKPKVAKSTAMSDKHGEPRQFENNVTALPNYASIKKEAGLWLVRIDQGELSNQQHSELIEWMNRSEFHHEYLEKLAKNWDSMSVLQSLADLFPSSHTDVSTPETGDPENVNRLKDYLFARYMTFAYGAIVLVCIALAIFIPMTNQATHHEFVTRVGEQATHQLTDGTSVVMNTDTHIRVDYSGELRAIYLLKGEANFDVAKNPNRPFVVHAGNGLVWAVGTAFNVRYTSDLVDVTVTEGVVKVYAEAEPGRVPLTSEMHQGNNHVQSSREAIVDAGQSIQYQEFIQRKDMATPSQLSQKLAWQQGSLIFQGETLAQVLHEIARYTDKELIIIDPHISDIRVGGYYKTDDIDGLLVALSKSFDLDLSTTPQGSIHLSSKKL